MRVHFRKFQAHADLYLRAPCSRFTFISFLFANPVFSVKKLPEDVVTWNDRTKRHFLSTILISILNLVRQKHFALNRTQVAVIACVIILLEQTMVMTWFIFSVSPSIQTTNFLTVDSSQKKKKSYQSVWWLVWIYLLFVFLSYWHKLYFSAWGNFARYGNPGWAQEWICKKTWRYVRIILIINYQSCKNSNAFLNFIKTFIFY